jgi:hypothetical protein
MIDMGGIEALAKSINWSDAGLLRAQKRRIWIGMHPIFATICMERYTDIELHKRNGEREDSTIRFPPRSI